MSTVSSPLPAATPLASLHMERSGDHVAPHPVTCVGCVHLNRGVLVVAAGGASITAGFDREWFPAHGGGDGGLFEGASPFPSSSPAAVLADGGRGLGECASMGGEKGIQYVHDAVEALLTGRQDIAQADNAGQVPKIRAPPLRLTSGHVTCLSVRLLPGGEAALGVVGTTVGSLCIFVADGDSLSLLREFPLQEWSNGMITVQDVVRSVGIGLDPAGRLEFVVASTAQCALVVDIQSIDDDRALAPGTQAIVVLEQSRQKQRLATLKRSRSATCVVPFVHAEVVRVLVPERFNAAFAFDLAAVLVLSDGTLRYIERGVRGGSVGLLHEQHARLQGANSRHGSAYSLDAMQQRQQEEGEALLTDARALPHVVYEYQLSAFQFNVSKAADGARFHERGVTVNDAALSYNARTGRMDIVLVGATQISTTAENSASQNASAAAAGAQRPALSALARRAMATGLLAPSTSSVGRAALATASAAHDAEQQQRLGWWAIARGAVLPQHTTRSILAKERWYASAMPDTSAPEVLAAAAADGHDAYVSAHTIHVQSSCVRLRRPRAPTSAYPPTAAVTGASAHAMLDGEHHNPSNSTSTSGSTGPYAHAGVAAPSESAPAHGAAAASHGVAAGVEGHRSELSALVVVRANDLALVASGTELYVASLSDAPVTAPGAASGVSYSQALAASVPSSTSLSALRHVRGGGTLCEGLACLSTAPATAAAVGAKNAVLSAGGSSVMLLTV